VIDPRAAIAPGAELDEGVSVGPFAVIGDGVRIGAGSWIGPHAVIRGPTVIGRDNKVFQFASVGEDPQDKKYRGAPTRLVIGDRNVIREGPHLHRGSKQEATVVGDDCFLMTNCHVGHDCRVGDGVVMATGATLAGHVSVGPKAFLSGYCLVHQFVRVGRLAMIQGGAAASQDVPPFTIAVRPQNLLVGVNVVGLRRAGLDYHELAEVRRHPDLDHCLAAVAAASGRCFALSGRGEHRYDLVRYRPDDVVVFGAERDGLGDEVLGRFPPEHRLRIPMRPDNRSLNLANAVAVVLYEAWRQHGFVGASEPVTTASLAESPASPPF